MHKLPKNRPIDRIDVNRLRKNNSLTAKQEVGGVGGVFKIHCVGGQN